MSFDHRYSDGVYNQKIAVLGLYPPPLGGVSVHIRRVIDKLRSQNNRVSLFEIEQSIRRLFIPLYSLKLFLWLVWYRPEIVYYHGTYLKHCWIDITILIFVKIFMRYRVVIVEHDCRHIAHRYRLFKGWYRHILRWINHVVFIGQRAHELYQEQKVSISQYSIEGAFLPPVVSTSSLIEKTYPSSLFIFIKDHTPIILINASHIMLIDTKDIYGLGISIDMLAGIVQRYPDIGLIMAIGHIDNHNYFDVLVKKMSQLNVSEHVYILQNQKELWPLFKHIDMFIRPTLSDGASISIQEALYFNIPVIASNIVTRPPNIITFETEDRNDFLRKVEEALDQKVYHAHQLGDSVYS